MRGKIKQKKMNTSVHHSKNPGDILREKKLNLWSDQNLKKNNESKFKVCLIFSQVCSYASSLYWEAFSDNASGYGGVESKLWELTFMK